MLVSAYFFYFFLKIVGHVSQREQHVKNVCVKNPDIITGVFRIVMIILLLLLILLFIVWQIYSKTKEDTLSCTLKTLSITEKVIILRLIKVLKSKKYK